jgi:hypothetical protein
MGNQLNFPIFKPLHYSVTCYILFHYTSKSLERHCYISNRESIQLYLNSAFNLSPALYQCPRYIPAFTHNLTYPRVTVKNFNGISWLVN